MPCEPRSIFVLRNNDIGDLLVITPLFKALRTRFPHARICAGVRTSSRDVLLHNPNVDEVLTVNAPWHHAGAPRGVVAPLTYLCASSEVAQLATRQFDIGIDVLGSPFGALLLMRCGIPFRLGVRGYAGGHTGAQRCVDYDSNRHVGRVALRFAEILGATELPENRPQLFLKSLPAPDGSIVFAPGGGYQEKCWPLDDFVALAGLLKDWPIKVIGGQQDRVAGARLAEAGGHVTDLTGRLSLRESFGIIAASKLVVSNSSMAMHATAAFRKPSLVLLGPAITSATQHSAQWGYPETHLLPSPTAGQAHEQARRILAA